MDQLVRSVYFSRIHKKMDKRELSNILHFSRHNNGKNHITGVLFMDKNYFVQLIEGDRTDVSNLMFTIAKDNRHFGMTLVGFEDVSGRLFSEWEMAFVGNDASTRKILMEASGSPEFEPRLFENRDLVNVLCKITKTLNKA